MRPIFYIGATVLATTVAVSAASVTKQTERFRDAAAVLNEIHKAPDKDIPADLWEKASCVVVIPQVKKAAFIVGGEYGKGVMSCRDGAEWTAPSFMTLGKGSIGFQIGAETVDLVLLVMNDHGVSHLLENKVALGAEASVAAGPVGRDARAMTDAQLTAEILSYSRTQGLFAGVDVTGGVLKPDNDDNEEFYGQRVTAHELLVQKSMKTPTEAEPFMRALHRSVFATN